MIWVKEIVQYHSQKANPFIQTYSYVLCVTQNKSPPLPNSLILFLMPDKSNYKILSPAPYLTSQCCHWFPIVKKICLITPLNNDAPPLHHPPPSYHNPTLKLTSTNPPPSVSIIYINSIIISLLSHSLRLPPPIISIRIKHKHGTVRKCLIKDMCKYQKDNKCRPLEPCGTSSALMVGCECDEGEEED